MAGGSDEDCFKVYWSSHMSVHSKSISSSALVNPDEQNATSQNDGLLYCLRKGNAGSHELPHFNWTGQLRPYPISKRPREVLDAAARVIRPGITTNEIDVVVHEVTMAAGGYPSPLNYNFFPKSCCTSVNEVICHGIPYARKLEDDDIVNVHVTVDYKGVHGDLNDTFFVGFFVVKSYCGHCIGDLFHCAPNIPHYVRNKAAGVMKAGQTFTIEPMINTGVWRDRMWPDGWIVVTADGKCSAQFEHTLLVTDTGVEVLTA
ncbi:methionine aminopeptidase 1A [Olea europaea subsp. europaea]|uniref:Methionine aminopeptidase 1A n=1 Tax=Olea europaea subsp. europaea TaxID=158383 RepID=A0A8S0TSM7_OLEEU|nr:methionine aminopeptidase 1A [Olea europaea subsp. europaea]